MILMKIIRRAAFLLGIAVLPASGHAQTTHNLTVSAEIVPGCRVAGGGPRNNFELGTLNFGVHPAVSRELATSTFDSRGIAFVCTGRATFTMRIDGGANPDARNTQRNLANGSARIAYQIFADAARTQAIGIGQPVEFKQVFGAVTLPGGAVPAGTYTDTLQITLSY
ncbi:spore coat U domain-containing protein [Paraburkholderia megapolitana]|nr:spore coat U domain-containing protein [Paraburkholderia sp. CHISQ3]MCX4161727.1 spore coat U domain-containing protein [Paraburkholderia megapolitana]MDN7157224.1 spore coat U domain-containing protein [Paraburkholderia sp. CHISQ3]MDQ6494269.1 spore coat U domain-containing protein [Paraburkholderia megapolitana]